LGVSRAALRAARIGALAAAFASIAALALAGCGGGDATQGGPAPVEGTKAAAPGVPTTKGGDNSIQRYGLEAGSEERAEAIAIVQGFLDARATDNWRAACSYLVESQRLQFEQLARSTERLRGGGCAAAMKALTGAAPKRMRVAEARIDVLSFRIGEENAFLIYNGVDGKAYATALADEDGTWKVISVAPTPLNPTG
jgi:hypothetical protein